MKDNSLTKKEYFAHENKLYFTFLSLSLSPTFPPLCTKEPTDISHTDEHSQRKLTHHTLHT